MRLGLLWTLGALSGILGAGILFDALPGVNRTIWITVTVAGLLVYRRPDPATTRKLAVPLAFVIILAIGASVTTTPILMAATALIVASLLALTITIAPDSIRAEDYGAISIVTAPFRGLFETARGLFSTIGATLSSRGEKPMRPVVRGCLIATPVVVVLALLFASADPFLAHGRDLVYNALSAFSDLPRLGFGALLTLFVTGAYTASAMARRADIRPADAGTPLMAPSAIGLTERQIVLGAAAAISWLFVLLQVSYLFGNLPAVAGSGVTFADYARRGFGELAVAATGVGLLIAAVYQRIAASDRSRAHDALIWPSLALLAAVCCILVSAFHRVSLYEDAYGYTTARVNAQAYIILTFVVLLVIAWHVTRDFDVRALARGAMNVALATLAILVFWNGDAWVARANIDRYAQTGKIDVKYLARELSPDAYPALIERLPRLAAVDRAQLAQDLVAEYNREPSLRIKPSWYEWNLRRSRARDARIGLTNPPNVVAPR